MTLSSSILPLVLVLSAIALGTILVLYRPLLLSSVSSELAAARGLPVRLIGAAYLFAMAVAVALSAVTIGAILSTALLVGPAATALQLTRRPGRAVLAAALIGTAATWLALWPSSRPSSSSACLGAMMLIPSSARRAARRFPPRESANPSPAQAPQLMLRAG